MTESLDAARTRVIAAAREVQRVYNAPPSAPWVWPTLHDLTHAVAAEGNVVLVDAVRQMNAAVEALAELE